MACLALTVQSVNGPDLLLQTREYFPPARAASASQSFKITRATLAADRRGSGEGPSELLGDDALAASSGQVVVGKDSRYRVVYRLVNSVYVLGITSADPDDLSNNVFDCTSTVNQAVSVLVAACRGVDVTPDKLLRKYQEVYLALTIVLRGISNTRLADILHLMASGDPLAIPSIDAENRARGAYSWNFGKNAPLDRMACMDVLTTAKFELPEEVLEAGDDAATKLGHPPGPTPQLAVAPVTSSTPPGVDPFAASAQVAPVNGPLVATFVAPSNAPSDPMASLAELTVPQPGATAAGFDSSGVENAFGDDLADGFGGGLEDGFGDDAFGGGLDASEFGATPEGELGGLTPQNELASAFGPTAGLAGLGALAGLAVPGGTPGSTTPPAAVDVTNSRLPLLWIKEEIHAEFRGLALMRVGLQGALHFRPAPAGLTTKGDTEFSFRLDGAAGLQRAVINRNIAGSLGEGLFHVRTPNAGEPGVVLKYRLRPKFTPLPLRIRVATKREEGSLAVMVQYVANPFLPGVITDASFVLQFPVLLQSVQMAPRGTLHKMEKQLRWTVPRIAPGELPQIFRAKIEVNDGHVWTLASMNEDNEELGEPKDDKESDDKKPKKLKEIKVGLQVSFASIGTTLSGMVVRPATEGAPQFLLNVAECGYKSGSYFGT